MCPTKEDRPAPWSQGQEAALKKEKDKITFTEHLSIQSTYCTGWHTPSHFPGQTLDRWSSAPFPPLFPASCPSPFPALLSLPTAHHQVLWEALGCPGWLSALRCVAQASSPKQDKQGLFSQVPLLLWHVFLHNKKQWIWLRVYSRKTQNRTPVPDLPLGALRKVSYSLGLGSCIHGRWPHFGPGLHKAMDVEHWAPGLAHVPIRSLCFVTPLSLPWHLLNPH